MDPWAYPADLEAIWRVLTDAETAQVAARIGQASQLIIDTVPEVGGLTVPQRLAAGTLSAVTVRDIVVAMVHRVMLNPGALRTEQTGPFAVTMDSLISSGEMQITRRELARLIGRRSSAFAFTIAPGPGPTVANPRSLTGGYWQGGAYYPGQGWPSNVL